MVGWAEILSKIYSSRQVEERADIHASEEWDGGLGSFSSDMDPFSSAM